MRSFRPVALKSTFGRQFEFLEKFRGYLWKMLLSNTFFQTNLKKLESKYPLFRTDCLICVTFLVILHNFSDGLMYWQEKQEDSKPNDNPWWRPYYRPRSADIEITAYALLAFSLNNDIGVGLAISRWLSQQRNSLGGYSSTQVLWIILPAFQTVVPT